MQAWFVARYFPVARNQCVVILYNPSSFLRSENESMQLLMWCCQY
jgi:hypothetical protein